MISLNGPYLADQRQSSFNGAQATAQMTGCLFVGVSFHLKDRQPAHVLIRQQFKKTLRLLVDLQGKFRSRITSDDLVDCRTVVLVIGLFQGRLAAHETSATFGARVASRS